MRGGRRADGASARYHDTKDTKDTLQTYICTLTTVNMIVFVRLTPILAICCEFGIQGSRRFILVSYFCSFLFIGYSNKPHILLSSTIPLSIYHIISR